MLWLAAGGGESSGLLLQGCVCPSSLRGFAGAEGEAGVRFTGSSGCILSGLFALLVCPVVVGLLAFALWPSLTTQQGTPSLTLPLSLQLLPNALTGRKDIIRGPQGFLLRASLVNPANPTPQLSLSSLQPHRVQDTRRHDLKKAKALIMSSHHSQATSHPDPRGWLLEATSML